MISSLIVLIITFISSWFLIVSGEALTYRLAPYENTCFYQSVSEIPDRRLFFYYAVQKAGTSGDSVDVSIWSPSSNVPIWQTVDVYSDQSFERLELGEYKFCFDNRGSFSSKTVDFDITLSVDDEWSRPTATPFSSPRSTALEQSLTNLGVELRTLRSYQRYFKQRDTRNMVTVQGTHSLIKWMTLFQILSSVASGIFQGRYMDAWFAANNAIRV